MAIQKFFQTLALHFKVFFTLKPYGNRLLTLGGRQWLVATWAIIFVMAVVEMIAWGYVGSLMSKAYPWLTAIGTGLIVFVIIWVLDSSLMLLDMRANNYAKRLEPIWETDSTSSDSENTTALQDPPLWYIRLQKRNQPAGLSKLFVTLWRMCKLPLGFLGRLFITVASMVITAPFLALLVFSQDIERQQIADTQALLEQERTEVSKTFDTREEAIDTQIENLRRERVSEIAGKGESGRYGRGPTADAITQDIAALNEQKRALEAARREVLAAVKPPEQQASNPITQQLAAMQRLSGEISLQDLVATQNTSKVAGGNFIQPILEIFVNIVSPPENAFKRAESAIRAFILFIILALVLLKIFQPASISLYLSERLQSLYLRYLDGEFNAGDNRIPKERTEREKNPLDFEQWVFQNYPLWLAKYINRSNAYLDANFDVAFGIKKAHLSSEREQIYSDINDLKTKSGKTENVETNIAEVLRKSREKLTEKQSIIEQETKQKEEELRKLDDSRNNNSHNAADNSQN